MERRTQFITAMAIVARMVLFGLCEGQACPSSCCRWFGTAPICSGVCPPGCSERARNDEGDGATCLTGTKALCDCCSAGSQTCAWYGTAPFCSGECPSGYRIVIRDTRGDGEVCLTGSKVLCARPGGTCNVCRPTSVQVDRTILGVLTYCRYYSGSQLCAIRICGIFGQLTLTIPPSIPIVG
jgi:hypothetical protein